MPATESTWRNTQLLHRIFAVSGVVLTIGTLWMFWKDHARSWKDYQVKINNIDLKMNKLRQEQFETGDAVLEHDKRATELAEAKALAIDPAALAEFKTLATDLDTALEKWRKSGHPYSTVDVNLKYIDDKAEQFDKLAATAQQKRADATAAEKAVDAALASISAKPDDLASRGKLESELRAASQAAAKAEADAAGVREQLVTYLEKIVMQAKTREDKALGLRKFKSADIDAAKANVDIAIRDNLPPADLQAREQRMQTLLGDMENQDQEATDGKDTYAALNAVYQSISGIRKALDRTVKQITAKADDAQKKYADSLADLERLKSQYQDKSESYFDFSDRWPFVLGKKVLTLPILDAFSSPRKIENLWSDGLTQSYNFSYVRRFDRCTTCHQSLTKTLPGTSASPAYVRDEEISLVVVPPSKESPPKPRLGADGKPLPLTVEDWLGLRLADQGLLNPDDVTIKLVLPKTPAAKAQITTKMPSLAQANGLEIRKAVAQLTSPPGQGENLFPKLPGLMVGDVIEGINGDPLTTSGGNRSPARIGARLATLAEEGKPITLTVRRGLPNPYTSHPRLDLYVGDASPHRLQTFACTICHDGQGSGTDFNWVSHTPNTTLDMERWRQAAPEGHRWFDNPHWIYPMFAKRFAEAACIKCHHDVVELEPSERFPDAPAPKVTHGYHLIRKYGCYGCHEVNGFDGPNKRIGPDLRSEPNYFAVAQQIEAELAAAERRAGDQAPLREQLKTWQSALRPLTTQLTAHPEDNQVRNQLKGTIEEGVATANEGSVALNKSLASLANMLKDVETPGTLRRAGPSLRFLAKKVDSAFLYDWIANPRHFRPSTRMPRFFGLWDHLEGAAGKMHDEKAPQLEPIEIRGLITYFQSYADDQQFEPEPRPSGIASWTQEEKVARGKMQFQTRGCLACHNHKDFPDVEKYRKPEEIVQGPDLSGVGSKFAKDRNPQGPDWLYSWIKNPTKYHARTVMPNLFLEPMQDPGADAISKQDDKWFDPADDIVTYFLASSKTEWQPIAAATTASQDLDSAGQQALQDLTLEYLNEAFYKDAAEQYFMTGIPPDMESELKGAEKDLIVQPGERLSDQQRLKYIGRKTVAKYGCFGCHDVPGFEDAKPIGTGLADWGRKDPARLAFEHITHYIEHGHGHAVPAGDHKSETAADALYVDTKAKSHDADPTVGVKTAEQPAGEHGAAIDAGQAAQESEDAKSFYTHALKAGNRIGFIYQKLKEPRSYDFEKTENKRYNERLRMPQFPFSAEEREAVITFILGLVADPPQPKYIFQAKGRNAALIAGKNVLEKYNCGGCHILALEKWKITYNPGELGERAEPAIYDFLKSHFSPQEIAAASKPDRRNELHATLAGLPPTDKPDGLPLVVDADGLQLDGESPYAQRELKFTLDLYQPAIVDGSAYLTGQSPVQVAFGQLDARFPTWGGTLTKYLLPEVTRIERQVNPNASGSEAYGWLPPPLIGEGNKVQTAWLHDFLLDPYPIRPAVFLRMPKFNMSSAEATALANYFAAADDTEFPYTYARGRDRTRLEAKEAEYVKRSAEGAGAATPPGASSATAPEGMQRLDDAMKIVVNGNFCVKCHLVADFEPAGSERAKAPNLAEVYRRLRPEYVRNWIANPKMILPYTSMPVNIPAQDPPAVLSQLYHGTNVEQIEALTDLLMNYDQYARQSTKIADRVQPAPAEGTPPAAGSATGSGSN